MTDLLTTREAAALLRYESPKTLRTKAARGDFELGRHYFKPPGSQLRWSRAALLAYLRCEETVSEPAVRLASGMKR